MSNLYGHLTGTRGTATRTGTSLIRARLATWHRAALLTLDDHGTWTVHTEPADPQEAAETTPQPMARGNLHTDTLGTAYAAPSPEVSGRNGYYGADLYPGGDDAGASWIERTLGTGTRKEAERLAGTWREGYERGRADALRSVTGRTDARGYELPKPLDPSTQRPAKSPARKPGPDWTPAEHLEPVTA